MGLNNDLGLTWAYFKLRSNREVLEHTTSGKVFKIFAPKCPNEYFCLTSTLFRARPNLLSKL